ncbi:MAG TPA: thiamine phosphate synthase [Armatimonadota bacterium]|nr:thiamine phosphate synthase [Armatimonadota bacterium]
MQRSLDIHSKKIDFSIYVITEQRPDRSPLEIATAAYDGGAGTVQFRYKGSSSREMFLWAQQLSALAREQGKILIINDRIDIAQAVKADGVHLGPDDLPVSVARRILGPTAIIGASAGTVDEAIEAEAEGASYLGVGCVYGTMSKDDAGDPIGPERVAEIRQAVTIPIVAIGGITATHIPELVAAGTDGIAVISAVTRAKNMKTATRELVKAMKGARALR